MAERGALALVERQPFEMYPAGFGTRQRIENRCAVSRAAIVDQPAGEAERAQSIDDAGDCATMVEHRNDDAGAKRVRIGADMWHPVSAS